jgi:hypothetical protein
LNLKTEKIVGMQKIKKHESRTIAVRNVGFGSKVENIFNIGAG